MAEGEVVLNCRCDALIRRRGEGAENFVAVAVADLVTDRRLFVRRLCEMESISEQSLVDWIPRDPWILAWSLQYSTAC